MSEPRSPLEVKPPVQKPGETAGEFIDRLHFARARLHPDLLNKLVRGIATPLGIKPWTQASFYGEAGTENQRLNPRHIRPTKGKAWQESDPTVRQERKAPLAPIVKRTPQQKLQDLSGMLFDLAKQCYDGTGVIRFPRSVVNEIVDTYRQMGVIKTPEDIEKESLEGIQLALDSWAKRMLNQNQRIEVK